MNAIQCVFWIVFGLYFAAGTLADPPVAPLWLGMAVSGAFVFRGAAAGGLALFRPGTRGFLVAAFLYLLSAWPMGLMLLTFPFFVPLDFGSVIMGLFGALLLWQAFRSQASMEELLRMMRTGGVPSPAAFGLEAPPRPSQEPPAPRGPARVLVLWGAPLDEVVVEDRAKFQEAVRENRILLVASGEGKGPRYVGVPTGDLPQNRSVRELPKEAVIRDPGTSQAFRQAGLKAAPGNAYVILDPRGLREVPP